MTTRDEVLPSFNSPWSLKFNKQRGRRFFFEPPEVADFFYLEWAEILLGWNCVTSTSCKVVEVECCLNLRRVFKGDRVWRVWIGINFESGTASTLTLLNLHRRPKLTQIIKIENREISFTFCFCRANNVIEYNAFMLRSHYVMETRPGVKKVRETCQQLSSYRASATPRQIISVPIALVTSLSLSLVWSYSIYLAVSGLRHRR